MDISKRLKTIASFADKPVIADIGCDHALVCIEAVLNGKVKKAYACDLRKGPLEQAKANIAAQGLDGQIEVRLQDGIKGLPDDTCQIIISGMGGKLIEQILSESPLPQAAESFLLSAHKDVEDLRRFLLEKGWPIEQEHTVFDQRFYTIIQASLRDHPDHSGQPGNPQTNSENLDEPKEKGLDDKESLLLGFHPAANQTYLDYLDHLEMKWLKIRAQMPDHAANLMDEKIQLVRSRRTRLYPGKESSRMES